MREFQLLTSLLLKHQMSTGTDGKQSIEPHDESPDVATSQEHVSISETETSTGSDNSTALASTKPWWITDTSDMQFQSPILSCMRSAWYGLQAVNGPASMMIMNMQQPARHLLPTFSSPPVQPSSVLVAGNIAPAFQTPRIPALNSNVMSSCPRTGRCVPTFTRGWTYTQGWRYMSRSTERTTSPSTSEPAQKRHKNESHDATKFSDVGQFIASPSQQQVPKKPDANHPSPFSLPRQWEPTPYYESADYKSDKASGVEFTMMSYNVLAQDLLESNMFLYTGCRDEVLAWKYRRRQLLAEITGHRPHIMCLQEVNAEHYEDFFLPEFEKLGYEGVYYKRLADKKDGCATFVQRDKFTIVNTVRVNYKRGGIADRDNVGIIVELKPVASTPSKRVETMTHLLVANTHLLFNPRRGDIKLVQLAILFAELDKLAYSCALNTGRKSRPDYPPVIVCGDMNSVPHSDIYMLLARAYLHYEGLITSEISGQEEGWSRNKLSTLPQKLWPDFIGISDQCQYLSEVYERNVPLSKSLENQILTMFPNTKRVGRNENTNDQGATVESLAPVASSTSSTCKDVSNVINLDNDCESQRTKSESVIILDDDSDSQRTISESVSTKNKDKLISNQDNTSSGNPSSDKVLNSSTSAENSSYGHHNMPSVSLSSGSLWHPFNLVSVHNTHCIQRLGGHNNVVEVTTQHQRVSSTLDYIFYSVQSKETRTRRDRLLTRSVCEGQLRLLARYGLMTGKELKQLGGLPNKFIGSDHLSLISRFLLK